MLKKRVLVVDDNDRFRKTLIEHLRECENAEVVDEARDGIEAIAKATTHRPDIILMDLAMPNCNGFEATRAIKALLPSTKIVVMTLNHGVEYHRMALQNGADDSIAKSALKDRLDDILTIAEKKPDPAQEKPASGPPVAGGGKKNSVENE